MTVLDAREGPKSDERLISADSHVAITHEQVRAHLARAFHADYDAGRCRLHPADGARHGGSESGRHDHEAKRQQRAYRGECRLQAAGLSGST